MSLNLIWYQFRCEVYQANRVKVRLWVAPGWAREVQRRLVDLGVHGRIQTTNRIDIKTPRAVGQFLRLLKLSPAMEGALARYEMATSQDVKGRVRPPALQLEQEAAARGLAALFCPPSMSSDRHGTPASRKIGVGHGRETWSPLS